MTKNNVIHLHEAKYFKAINASFMDTKITVNSLANLLKIKAIKHKEYKAYIPSKKLNYVYIVHDITQKDIRVEKASWNLLNIYFRSNQVVLLKARVEPKQKNYILGPLYIDGRLYFTSPSIHDFFSYVSSYVTKNIYPELKHNE